MLTISYFYFLLIVTGVCAEQATNWISVNCTWPCSDNKECIVTNKAIECQQVHNSQWVLSNPESSPVFRGETARLNQPCVVLPTPPLVPTTTDTSSSSSTVILWPPNDVSNPTDAYLSDCDNSTYCALESDMCIPRLLQNSVCVSTNQCIAGLICTSNDGTKTICSKPKHSSHDSDSKTKIGYIVAIVLGILILLILLGIMWYRRRRQRRMDTTKPSLVALETLPVAGAPGVQSQFQPSSYPHSSPHSPHSSYPHPTNASAGTGTTIINSTNSAFTFIPTSTSMHAHHPHHTLIHNHTPDANANTTPNVNATSTSTVIIGSTANHNDSNNDNSHNLPIYPDSSTPSMQQQQLQRQLQLQHHYNQPEADNKNTVPPPPYVP
ncbi:hypothetical protein J3Q64DRAFT_1261046 [Phycomyces blakesleeanus]|uniref:Uncharacterized protein n=2 Tax=Phycomyces blakesleeanus TaxID=4837 RepID=A0A167JIB4_PHYB8|nr:hypothetical protein PHYBLDRAFT_175553 [Phycomyces blakesleeanus NRRL 1555(-)]OAD66029.1 hypothetical protein PHYBLDRAFT_175553 [Phycomyces blakesleeanus NRRL 1555(-)]|eukprot:XP_018284069.1 hypothetical protein PHYBLDRAFT_175553 [Phycomyces blakesleeanus NRRL 1555(-)]